MRFGFEGECFGVSIGMFLFYEVCERGWYTNVFLVDKKV